VGRYLRGETGTHLPLPLSYFDEDTAQALTALREQAISRRSEELLTYVSTALEHGAIENTWHSTATRLYGNWLQYIREQKDEERLRNMIGVITNDPGVDALTMHWELTQIDGMA
jgi:hypothetical protein